MRILHFCNYAERIGGAEVYAQSLVSALRERGHEVLLFGTSPERDVDRPELRVVRRPLYDADRLVQDPPVRKALSECLQRFRPDVLHAHNLFSVGLDVVEILASSRVPLVHTVHDFQLLCPNSWCVRGDGSPCPGGAGAQCFQHGCQANAPYDAWGVLLAALRQRLVADGTDIALAPSQYLVDRLKAHGWCDVRHRPYFIDFEPAPPRLRDSHEILYVGRLEREKGVDVLLDAVAEIRSAVPELRLTVLGKGSESLRLRRRSEAAGLASFVSFRDNVPREQLGEFYSRAALCVLPSVWTENSPLVAYECLASGLPMVGSLIGGIPELIEPDCGYTFAAGDPRALAKSVLRLLSRTESERAQMSVAARDRSRSFDKKSHLTAVESAYAEASERGPRSHPASATAALLPILAEVRTFPDSKSLLERARGLARSLGLPKVFRG